MADKIKISIIGTGHLGSIHCRLLKQNPMANFVGIYDINKNRADAIACELNVKPFESIEDTLENSEAVIITTPTSHHFNIAEICLKSNMHCFIEKPVTSSVDEANRLISIARRYPELVVQVGHIERFNPAMQAALKYDINPLFIETHRLSQFRPRAIDVSVIHDLMIHDIDIILWLTKSKIKNIEANGVNVITDTTDIANARISFENGTVANLTASRISAKPMRKMRLFQHFGYFSIDFAKPDIDVFRLATANDKANNMDIATILGDINAIKNSPDIIFEKPEIKAGNAMAEEQTEFIKCIINNKIPMVTLTSATEALHAAEEINNQITTNIKKN